MGFGCQGLWVIGYQKVMGFQVKFPAYQVGGPKKLWDIRGYGLSQLWVMTESTVISFFPIFRAFGQNTVEIAAHDLNFDDTYKLCNQ